MNLIRRYLMVIITGISLLLGIQIPNFLDQYEKRIDAHLREVTHNLNNYQRIAAKHHAGSLHSLIASHKSSYSEVFKSEGFIIEEMNNRKIQFEIDKKAMNTGLFFNAIHVITNRNNELLQETFDHYSYAVPLNQDAIVSGVGLAMIAIFLIEVIFSILGMLVRKVTTKRKILPIVKKQPTRA